jgi:hypothetical protein
MTADHRQPPTDETILAHLLGDSDMPGASSVPDAVAADGAVRARAQRLGRLLQDVKTAGALSGMFRVEPAQREMLRRIADRPEARADGVGGSLAARVARLVLDSFASASPGLGFRGTASDRLVRYESGGLTVDLRVSGSGDDGPVEVSGELLPAGPALISLTDASGQTPEVLQPVGDDGFFAISAMSGRYRLIVETPEATIDLGEIGLGTDAAPDAGPGPTGDSDRP